MTERGKKPLFNAGAAVYDSFKFLHAAAELTAARADLVRGERVLDIACGTGRTTIAAAGMVGDTGHVTGIDIADKLLDVAVEKTGAAGLTNADYRVMDACAPEFDSDSFDVVLCASSLFLFSDIPAVLREWCRVLKGGGRMVISTFGRDIFKPVIGLIEEKLAEYKDTGFPAPVSAVTDTPEKCRKLLEAAGFRGADIITEPTAFYTADAAECWRQVASSLIVRPRLAVLDSAEREKIKTEIITVLDSFLTAEGIRVEVPVILITVRK
jgi:ubiquinone/menaquinone biosynthesis C-methylase UbiE